MCLHCHVVTLGVEIRSLVALAGACSRLGWQFRADHAQYRWAGYWADDSPVPRHLFESQQAYEQVLAMSRPDRTAFMQAYLAAPVHTIHVPGYEYELGVFRVADRWEVVGDWWGDIRAIVGPGGKNPLPQAYAIEVARLTARANGYSVEETVDADGTVQLTATSY